MQARQCNFQYGLTTPPLSPSVSPEPECAEYAVAQPCPQPAYFAPVTPVEPSFPQEYGHILASVPSLPEQRIGTLVGCYRLEQVIGVGAYGVVYLARDIRTNLPYAVKALNKIGLDSRQSLFQRREIFHHHQACRIGQSDFHPNIVSLLKLVDTPDCLYAVLEYCPEGDLFMNITEKQRYFGRDGLIRDVFLQILDAVEHCHSRGIYHRDLKPENILVTNNGRTVKLADFGLATTEAHTMDHGCGSQFYMSPECLQPQHSGYSSAPNDIWSLGVILVNLTCGRNPWRKAALDDSTYLGYMNDRTFLQSILPLTSDLNYVLTRMFDPDPMRRATISEIRHLMNCCTKLTTNSQETMPNLAFHGFPFQVPMFNQIRAISPSQASISSDSSDSSVDSVFSVSSTYSSSSESSVSQHEDLSTQLPTSQTPVFVQSAPKAPSSRNNNLKDRFIYPFQQYVTKTQQPAMVANEYVPRANQASFFRHWQQSFRLNPIMGH